MINTSCDAQFLSTSKNPGGKAIWQLSILFAVGAAFSRRAVTLTVH